MKEGWEGEGKSYGGPSGKLERIKHERNAILALFSVYLYNTCPPESQHRRHLHAQHRVRSGGTHIPVAVFDVETLDGAAGEEVRRVRRVAAVSGLIREVELCPSLLEDESPQLFLARGLHRQHRHPPSQQAVLPVPVYHSTTELNVPGKRRLGRCLH